MEKSTVEFLQLYLQSLENESDTENTDNEIIEDELDESNAPHLVLSREVSEIQVHIDDFLKLRSLGRVNGRMNREYYTQRWIPNKIVNTLDDFGFQINVGQFSRDGKLFYSGSHDHIVRVYNSQDIYDGISLQKKAVPFQKYKAMNAGFSIMDVAMSTNNDFFCYSSWSPLVNLVFVGLEKSVSYDMRPEGLTTQICGFSVKLHPNNREFVVGASDKSIYLFDIEFPTKVKRSINAHDADVNAVCYLDENTLISGGDDTNIRLWDSRMSTDRHVSSFSGQSEGITSLASKGDGNYFLSNSKDQSMKLWDCRKPSPHENKSKSMSTWDYRYQQMHPSRLKKSKDHIDSSVHTYVGHHVLQTLIKCYFSPDSTDNKFVYSGSQDGTVYIYDCESTQIVSVLHGHTGVVRDCAWHPSSRQIVTSSWDKKQYSWEFRRESAAETKPDGEYEMELV